MFIGFAVAVCTANVVAGVYNGDFLLGIVYVADETSGVVCRISIGMVRGGVVKQEQRFVLEQQRLFCLSEFLRGCGVDFIFLVRAVRFAAGPGENEHRGCD